MIVSITLHRRVATRVECIRKNEKRLYIKMVKSFDTPRGSAATQKHEGTVLCVFSMEIAKNAQTEKSIITHAARNVS